MLLTVPWLIKIVLHLSAEWMLMDQIGEKLRLLRKLRKITLKQLAKETELSVGFLSLVENGKSNIALDTLSRLLVPLGSNLNQFFEKSTNIEEDPVVRSVERTWSPFTETSFTSALSHNPSNFKLYPRIFLMHPEATPTKTDLLQHDGEEFIMVLEGVATIYYAGSSYLLYPGDSIQIHSYLPHNWVNKSNKDVKLLSVHFPNLFFREGTSDSENS
ncbi:XRE family transcriptional regulator [Oscillibacter sp.]|uniref:helix-turn-helix domain-containing protein n=1 Tax=Oscillibacter sp. TaxID=1945593 RepID=UPI0028A6ACCD|nr:XRE family transcriptional regulator [Oscillibacter sp.]